MECGLYSRVDLRQSVNELEVVDARVPDTVINNVKKGGGGYLRVGRANRSLRLEDHPREYLPVRDTRAPCSKVTP